MVPPGDGRLGRRVGVSGGSVVSALRAGLGGWVGGRGVLGVSRLVLGCSCKHVFLFAVAKR